MKTRKLREELAAKVEDAVRLSVDQMRSEAGFHVLSVRFENRSVDIPFEPWKPRQSIALPGRWVQDGEA